jgi:hypothetical protein
MVQSLSRVVPSLQERWMPPVIRAHAAGMERFDARSVLRTGFISTLHPWKGAVERSGALQSYLFNTNHLQFSGRSRAL